MMKLFRAPSLPATDNQQPDVRYTRFYHRNARATPVPPTVEHSDHPKHAPMPPAPQGRRPNAARVQPPKFDENAQLYSEARISINVLRNALPMRFAVME